MISESERWKKTPEAEVLENTPGTEHGKRINPRWVFTDPDDFFDRDYYDLLIEQQEQS